ncbi:MAG: hypothetical protein KatS3mg115_2383 [Candidatus Poribacteria bacterium]|nr:MAG: hypothetical protein KatS3mg115_2383 [Candidatus Poribacteria bacterium]
MLFEIGRLTDEPERVDLRAIREKLRGKRGQEFWRSLEELSETPEFRRFLEEEFPANAAERDGLRFDRRQFLKLMGASLALAGLTGCDPIRAEKIVPAVKPVEELLPGRPIYYATAVLREGYGLGVLVESHEGRPTKIEGNPDHPASLGATDAIAQAEVLNLYDPDRSQVVMNRGVVRTWATLRTRLQEVMAAQSAGGGAGVRILTGAVTSPTFRKQIEAILDKYPQRSMGALRAGGRLWAAVGCRAPLRLGRAHLLSARSSAGDPLARRRFSVHGAGRRPLCAGVCRRAARRRRPP